MKANELRIGKLIHNPVQNIDLRVTVDLLSRINYDCFNTQMNPKDKFQPIPLTEEWLLKLGFNKDYKNGWIGIDVESESGMTIDFVLAEPLNMGEWQKYYAFVYDSYRFTKLEYVHELQNLYFALTNEELTIQ